MPKKMRQASWKYRLAYMIMNGVVLFWVFELPNTSLWLGGGRLLENPKANELNLSSAVGLLFVVLCSWISFFILQASDPGFLTADMLTKAGFDPSTGDLNFSTETLLGAENSSDESCRSMNSHDTSASAVEIELVNNSTATKVVETRPDLQPVAYETKSVLDDVLIKPQADPYHVVIGSSDEEDDEIVAKEVFEQQVIAQMEFNITHLPLRARWCRRSERYVAKYDHYCHIIGTCVGERNHCRFWWFLLTQSSAMAWAIGIAISGVRYRTGWVSWWVHNGEVFACTAFLWVIFLSVFSLCCFHTFLAMSNMTTFELHKGSRIDYLADFEECDLPFSKGLCTNIRLFCWVLPRGTSGIDAGVGPRNRKLRWLPAIWDFDPPKKFNRNSRDWWNNLWENKYWSCC